MYKGNLAEANPHYPGANLRTVQAVPERDEPGKPSLLRDLFASLDLKTERLASLTNRLSLAADAILGPVPETPAGGINKLANEDAPYAYDRLLQANARLDVQLTRLESVVGRLESL